MCPRLAAPICCRFEADTEPAIGLGDRYLKDSGVSALVVEVNLSLSRQNPSHGFRDDRPDRISYLDLGKRSV